MTITDTDRATWIDEARKLGEEHARNAASWAYDGNSDREERARVLAMLRDGDPAAWDYLPREPNLSGEMADDPTPKSIAEDILGNDLDDAIDDYIGIFELLADAYEDGVRETFSLACEAELITFCEEN